MSNEQIVNRIYITPLDIVSLSPGISVVQYKQGGTAANFIMRGFSSNSHGPNTAIFLDGIPLNEGDGYADYNTYEANFVGGLANEDWDQVYSIQAYHTDGYQDNSKWDKLNAATRVTRHFTDRLDVRLSLRGFNSEWNAPDYINQETFDNSPTSAVGETNGGGKDRTEARADLDFQVAGNSKILFNIWGYDQQFWRWYANNPAGLAPDENVGNLRDFDRNVSITDDYDNIGETTRDGFEIAVDATAFDYGYLHADYAYVDARYDSYVIDGVDLSGKTLRSVPENIFNVEIGYSPPAGLGGRLRYHYEDCYYLDDANLYKSDVWDRVDVQVSYRFGSQALYLFALDVVNLLDEKYAEYSSGTTDRTYSPALPLSVYATFVVDF